MDSVSTVLLIDARRCSGGVAQFIQMNAGFHVVGEAASGREGVGLALDLKPDVILVDLDMPELGGIETIALLREKGVHALSGDRSLRASESHLAAREHEVLDYLVEGLCNKVIAHRLDISVGTVKVHVKHLLRKLDLHSRLEAVVWHREHVMRHDPPRM